MTSLSLSIQLADFVTQSFIGLYAMLEYKSLEPLIDILAFLVLKLCQKIQIFPDFWHKLAGISLLKVHQNKPSKDSHYSLESKVACETPRLLQNFRESDVVLL